MNRTLKIIIIVFVIADIAAILGYYGAKFFIHKQDNAVYTAIDINKAVQEGQLPPGYPAGLPIPDKNLIDQTVIKYPTHGLTLTSLAFVLRNSVEQTATMYRTFFNANGYDFQTTVSGQIVTIHAAPLGSASSTPATSVSVVLTPQQDESTWVNIAITSKNQ